MSAFFASFSLNIQSAASLSQWWDMLTLQQQVFWGIALFFSILLLLQFISGIMGLGGDSDGAIHGMDDHSIDPGFTWLSLRSILAFFCFFGWTGVILSDQQYPLTWILVFSLFVGLIAMSVVVYLLYLFSRMTQSGNFQIKSALFQQGTVYSTIPGEKQGKGLIHITINKASRELHAVTEGRPLASGESIRVIGILEDNILLVESVQAALKEKH